MKFLKNKTTRVLILVMGTLFILALVFADQYYKYENRSVDPRVYEAHELYDNYNRLAENSQFDSVFILMDLIEDIYKNIDHYAESYEVGVLYNNRAATYIAQALNCQDSLRKDSLLNLAEYNSLICIDIYSAWIDKFESLNDDEIKEAIIPDFDPQSSDFQNKNVNRYIKKRVKQIKDAQIETPRRLSVSYTNLGLVYRHKMNYDEAVKQYLTALELWPDNLAAENNLNILFDKPLKKRSVIRAIFPKDRK